MAESTLSIGFAELCQEVGFYLGMGRGVVTAWTASQLAEITGVVQSGIRRVYYPPATVAMTVGYEWSWLRPNETLELRAPYSTGTVTVVDGVVTLLTGTFPSWAAQGSFIVDGLSVGEVNTRDSNTQITLVDLTVDAAAGSTYNLSSPVYDLPDNFGRLIGELHYPEASYRRPIAIISAGKLQDMRARSNVQGYPQYAATRYKSSTGSTGQRQEILFYPTPNDDSLLSYEYEAYSGALSTTYPYPLGGMQLAEVYIESCLALAETRINDTIGQHAQQFQSLLVDAIMRDRKRGAQRYGQMGQGEIEGRLEFRSRFDGPSYPITYNGTQI